MAKNPLSRNKYGDEILYSLPFCEYNNKKISQVEEEEEAFFVKSGSRSTTTRHGHATRPLILSYMFSPKRRETNEIQHHFFDQKVYTKLDKAHCSRLHQWKKK